MSKHKHHFTELFFGTWYTKFDKLTDLRHLFTSHLGDEKLGQHLFFHKMKAEVFPSYNFGVHVFTFINDFSTYLTPGRLAYFEKSFKEDEEAFLKRRVHMYITYGRYFLQVLRDFGIFYPKYDIKFDDVECIYFDLGIELPKVLDSFLGELIVRDAPLREKILPDPLDLALSHLTSTILEKEVFPPVSEDLFTEEALSNHIVDFLIGEDETSKQLSLLILNFYFKSRPHIKVECSSVLASKGITITDASLMKYFLGEYIFKDVSKECKRFFVANCNLKEKNPLRLVRERALSDGNSYTLQEQHEIMTRAAEGLKGMTEHLAYLNSLTLEEKAERHRQALAETLAEDLESLPKVSLSGLIALGESRKGEEGKE